MASMFHIIRAGFFGLALAVATATMAAPARAQTVAIVDGTELTRDDVVRLFEGLRPEVQANGMQALYPFLLEELIAREVMVSKARAEGFDQTPDMVARLEAFEMEMIYNAYVVDQAEAQVSDADIQTAYDTLVEQMPEEEEINVSHILVETREEAESIIERVTAGEQFAELAREHSIDTGSGANGGELGWSRRGMFVPQFEEAAFALEANTFTGAPVESDFGWHVILVSERRQIQPPPLEEVTEPLRQRLAEQQARSVVESAVANASVERFDMDGNPMPAQ